MNAHSKLAALATALVMALAVPASAKTVQISGMSCWTGKLDLISTTDKDMGWAYSLNYTWLADNKDPQYNLSGRCVSSGGMVNGKYESAPFFCTVVAADGSKRMTRGIGGPKGSKSAFFGGTGVFKGVTGQAVGGPRIKLPAPKGHFAACRHDEVEYTLPD
jgi:hypothetical protein